MEDFPFHRRENKKSWLLNAVDSWGQELYLMLDPVAATTPVRVEYPVHWIPTFAHQLQNKQHNPGAAITISWNSISAEIGVVSENAWRFLNGDRETWLDRASYRR